MWSNHITNLSFSSFRLLRSTPRREPRTFARTSRSGWTWGRRKGSAFSSRSQTKSFLFRKAISSSILFDIWQIGSKRLDRRGTVQLRSSRIKSFSWRSCGRTRCQAKTQTRTSSSTITRNCQSCLEVNWEHTLLVHCLY